MYKYTAVRLHYFWNLLALNWIIYTLLFIEPHINFSEKIFGYATDYVTAYFVIIVQNIITYINLNFRTFV